MDQASRWAKRTARRVREEKGYVSVYEIDDELMQTLRILRFEKTDAEWLRFVVDNRKGVIKESPWDLICGPVANDQTIPVINLYLDGMYDEEETIKRLLPQKLKDQYTFKSEKAIALLRCIEVISI